MDESQISPVTPLLKIDPLSYDTPSYLDVNSGPSRLFENQALDTQKVINPVSAKVHFQNKVSFLSDIPSDPNMNENYALLNDESSILDNHDSPLDPMFDISEYSEGDSKPNDEDMTFLYNPDLENPPEDSFSDYNATLDQYQPNENEMSQEILLVQEDIKITIFGMAENAFAIFVFKLLCVLSLGLLYVLSHWFPKKKIQFTMDKCSLQSADFICVNSSSGEISLEKVEHIFYGGKLEDLFGDLASRGPLSEKRNTAISKVHIFGYRHHRFLFHPLLNKFLSNGLWKSRTWVINPYSVREGLSISQKNLQSDVFGLNDIIIPEKSTTDLLIGEVLHPFYVFQIASVILWTFDDYIYYATCILVISTVSVFVSLIETKRNVQKIQEMAKFECSVEVFRDRIWRTTSSLELVPGDVINISGPNMSIIPCDALILEGNCITNESMLTGESIPVAKTPSQPDTFDKIDLMDPTFPSEISKHVVFSGTNLIRARKNELGLGGKNWIQLDTKSKERSLDSSSDTSMPARCTALVIRTGFNTTKGVLIRSILFPRQSKFKLYEDAFKFIGVLSVIALLGFLASVANFLRLGISYGVIIIRALDLITVAVPPALPASMSIGTSFALNRLREKLIYCISPSRINVCGRVNLVGFDKTGTITEEGLDVLGVQKNSLEDKRLGELIKDIKSASECHNRNDLNADLDLTVNLAELNFLNGLATCHSINIVNGNFVGDPLDIKMFECTGWSLEEHDSETNNSGKSSSVGKNKVALPAVVRPPRTFFGSESSSLPLEEDPALEFEELGIVKKFDFLPSLRRMSVIVRKLGAKDFQCYVKGAPETIKSLCIQSSIPQNFSKQLSEFTHNGYRVLAIGGKTSKMTWPNALKIKRDQLECDLTFLGFVIFENKLKPTSEPVLNELKVAKIRTLMCTGDNSLTAISVARQCNMIKQSTRIFMPRLLRLNPASIYDYDASFFNTRFMVLWQDIEDPQRILDPYSLEPLICNRVDFSCIEFDSSEDVLSADHPLQLVSNPIIDFKLVKSRDYALAITGEIFRHFVDKEPKEKLNKMLMLGTVYARMSPDEKGELMELLEEIGYCTAFCGDGANDCSALKAADIGISLSEAESSVAAPFTSKRNDIRCVLDVIKEGRASLVTSFSCFKYMACYMQYIRGKGNYGAVDEGNETRNVEESQDDFFQRHQRIFDPDTSYDMFSERNESGYMIRQDEGIGSSSRLVNEDNNGKSKGGIKGIGRSIYNRSRFKEVSSWLEMGFRFKPVNNIGKKRTVKTYKKILNDLGKSHLH
ncbi:putative cation-transporting ATPase [Smittium mucronatum]|uniref:Cation-transporting ATPase n=1 Tax=Smittium mucronatum TaxID=133383 RepID=A0A1R0GYV2_9FUNG|nr:putative cation-transporting ATPase [Smittium mucronatum]